MGVLIKNKINYTGSGDFLNQPVIYSDSERCIGVWRDGKPLYQKTWNFTEGQVFPVRDTWFDTNIEAEYIDKIIFASGYRSDSNYVGIIGAGLNQSNHIVLMQGRDNNFGNFKGFTLQYTKTTDTAGTGPWAPTGATPIHYSLEEQVIGTWIDGKPLYQITLLTTSTVSGINDNSWSNIPANNTPQNIKELITASYRGLSYLTSELFRFGYDSSSNSVTIASYKSNSTLRSGSYITIQYTKTTD